MDPHDIAAYICSTDFMLSCTLGEGRFYGHEGVMILVADDIFMKMSFPYVLCVCIEVKDIHIKCSLLQEVLPCDVRRICPPPVCSGL